MNVLRSLRSAIALLASTAMAWAAMEARAAESIPADAIGRLPAVLTNAQQVLALGFEGARRARTPVRLRLVVTQPFTQPQFVTGEDATGAVLVNFTNTDYQAMPGQLIEVEGLAQGLRVGAGVDQAQVRVLGTAPLPTPKRAEVARLAAGEDFLRQVSLTGWVRDLKIIPSRVEILVASGDQHFMSFMPFSSVQLPSEWLDAQVELHGQVIPSVNDKNQPTGFILQNRGTNDLTILEPGRGDIFAAPPLVWPVVPSGARVRITGVVTFAAAGRLFVQSAEGAIQGSLLEPISQEQPYGIYLDRSFLVPLQPGDRVELVGAPTASNYAPWLVDVEYRRLGHGLEPPVTTVTGPQLLTGRFDASLVRIQARVRDREWRRESDRIVERLTLEADEVIFQAQFHGPATHTLDDLPLGAIVQATGICTVEAGPWKNNRTARLLLRGPEDVRYLGPSPFWATWPLRRIAGSGLALSFTAGIWIFFLRRQVRERTAELARFAAIADATKDVVSITDLDQRIIYLNPAGHERLGAPSTGSAEPRKFADVLPDWANRVFIERAIPEALRHGSWSGELALSQRDGSEIPVSMVSMIIRAPDGTPQHMAAILRDISDRKRTEAELLKAIAAEKAMGELRSRFVSMVSHEFRTPLGVILTSSDLLDGYLDRLSPERRSELISDIRSSTRRMSEMMEDVLFLSCADAGKLSFRPEPIRLRSFCESLVDEILSASNHRCPVQLDTPDELISGDPALLRHIVTNLISNAIKYSPPNRAVDLRVTRASEEVVFEVVDRGIGIPESDGRGLFQPFHRGSNVGEIPGTGLGLTIVKRCVDLHGGEITWRSSAGGGTTFRVTLPSH